MNSFFSISISFAILIQSFGISLNDLSQIDEFIEHAQFHNEQYGDSIFVFISKHYGELKSEHEKDHQEEKEDHQQLPFNHNNYSHIPLMVVFLNSFKGELKGLDFSERTETNFYYQEISSSLYLEGILQPPRHS